jgi:hypothetical protein
VALPAADPPDNAKHSPFPHLDNFPAMQAFCEKSK